VHVERLFPGADLSFDEELGLASVTRPSIIGRNIVRPETGFR